MMRPRRNTARVDIDRVSEASSRKRRDAVAVEEPLEIRIVTPVGEEHQVAVTMRTPGDDFDLAAGFLFSEGLLAGRSDVADLRYCADVEIQEYNIVTVHLSETARFDPAELTRNFYTTSSCGVCGKASLEAIEIRGCAPVPAEGPIVAAEVVRTLPEALRSRQPVFERTGGLHAAGLFDTAGELRLLREDIGRHNALDKVIGDRLLQGDLPLGDAVLAVSGRASFEIMQKALTAGIAIVVAVGAPSSLAVDVAKEFGMTLVGFAKPTGFNVYTSRHRVV
ncbi:formate dehydrogenase accessory sulfurtransferase FdhD [Candidatus Palauibacter sp.]|uniref:formate dehydrogenase accessory sulfurtransferase FdhD n=1 Tax=Candidatus Palauibacter sp. TaxID=3101350 RepID=UPI003B020E09